jgi:hypothetical protein
MADIGSRCPNYNERGTVNGKHRVPMYDCGETFDSVDSVLSRTGRSVRSIADVAEGWRPVGAVGNFEILFPGRMFSEIEPP